MQRGSLTREVRQDGPDVWNIRWREIDGNGKMVLRRLTFGTVEEYPTEAEAWAAIGGLIRQINSGEILVTTSNMAFGELTNHFKPMELRADNDHRSYSTKRSYMGNLERWIEPRWKSYKLHEVKAVEVES